jgi:hypothetical protein
MTLLPNIGNPECKNVAAEGGRGFFRELALPQFNLCRLTEEKRPSMLRRGNCGF